MIKKLASFLVTFLVVSLLYFALVYAVGLLLQEMGIALYESERDQQRNFNIVLGAWLVISASVSIWRVKNS